MPSRPPERPDGQDDPPDVLTALRATIGLLADIRDRLETRPNDAALVLRVVALRGALIRLRDHLDEP